MTKFSNMALTLFLVLNILGITITASAKDFGVHGETFKITESSLVEVIKAKLRQMEDNGELQQHQQYMQQKMRQKVIFPDPVPGISRATKTREFFYDPTITAKEDVYDHLGRLVVARGSKANPLAQVSLSQHLIFIAGDDPEQVAWLKQGDSRNAKIILTSGSPVQLAEKLGKFVYFDQFGALTSKLGIKATPALVRQQQNLLQIREIYIKPQEEQ